MVKLFKNMTKKDGVLAGVSVLFIVAQVWLDLKLPDYMSEITILVQTPGSKMRDIYAAGGMMLLSAFGSLVASIFVAVLAAKISTNFGANLRKKLFNNVLSFSLEEISEFSTASLITRSTNDITQIQTLIVMGLQVVVKAPILAFWAFLKISGKSWQWTMATGIAVILLLVIVGIAISFVLPKFKLLQRLTDKLNHVTRENLTGLRVVRAYNAEIYQMNKFENVNDELTDTNLFTTRTMSLLMPFIQLIMNGLSLAIYWIGAILIQNAALNDKLIIFSDMVVFSSYAMQILSAFMMLIIIFIMVPRASVSANRVLEVIETEPGITDGTIFEPKTQLKGNIIFENVSFKYPDAEDYVLENISFTASQGETVAFIGSTGSGKSTLINLIPRLYDATDGKVLVDGVNVKDYKQDALHNKIGYVSQRASLFKGTVKSNITYGDNGQGEIPQLAIENAVHTAQADDFVYTLDGGYEGFVTPGGTNFSGGQKQRLSIARAIARNPEILIFDDSFSALDYKTDRELRASLNEHSENTTKMIVAQRIGTIRDADRIIVLDQGRMVGNGTHDELMETCEVYQEIAYSQLSKEELN